MVVKDVMHMIRSAMLQMIAETVGSKVLMRRAAASDFLNLRAAIALAEQDERDALETLTFRVLQAWRWCSIVDDDEDRAESERIDRVAELFFGDMGTSHSQLMQDTFVLHQLCRKRGGFFVEIGVGDGVKLSNTYLLERSYGWRGILAEPNPVFHRNITAARKATLDTRVVYSDSGLRLEFLSVDQAPELSTLRGFGSDDRHRREGTTIVVESVSLTDLLRAHDAPRHIDYISIDTEGSELEILRGFDFDSFKVAIFTIEHNNVAARRDAIADLMRARGYAQVWPALSRFDGWFVKQA